MISPEHLNKTSIRRSFLLHEKTKKIGHLSKGDSCIEEMPLTHSYYGYYVINIQINRH